MYLTSFIKSIFFFMAALFLLIVSPLSAEKPVKTDATKEKNAPTGKVRTPIVQETLDNTIPFDSYGAFAVALEDDLSNSVDLSANITVTYPSLGLNEYNIIPLWYYDYEQGFWFEESYAELHTEGSYQGEISYCGTWSLNNPIENTPGTYRGHIVFEDGAAAKDIYMSFTLNSQ